VYVRGNRLIQIKLGTSRQADARAGHSQRAEAGDAEQNMTSGNLTTLVAKVFPNSSRIAREKTACCLVRPTALSGCGPRAGVTRHKAIS
jgi:hypothetical protein